MIPVSIADQLIALVEDREAIEREPTHAWNAYLQGWREASGIVEDPDADERKPRSVAPGVVAFWNSTRACWRYIARIYGPGAAPIALGTFDTLEEAIAAVHTRHLKLHGTASKYWNFRHQYFTEEEIAQLPRNSTEGRKDISFGSLRARKNTQASIRQGPSKSGLPSGVIRRKTKKGDRFSAVIHDNGKTRMIATYHRPEQAHAAYVRAHIELHGEQSRYWSKRHEYA